VDDVGFVGLIAKFSVFDVCFFADQMETMALMRFNPPFGRSHALSFPLPLSSHSQFHNCSIYLTKPTRLPQRLKLNFVGGGGSGGVGRGGSDGGDGSWGGDDGNSKDSSFGILGLFLNGWRSRVAADPQFPFKVVSEELVGVSSAVLGDMATRPNFGLNELDFVFSTLVVGAILNFTLMYLLAPTLGSSSVKVPAIFASCPKSHMFEPGAYSLLDRFGTLVYKGTIFAVVGLGAGLVGTVISNGLVKMRKKMDPNFESPNKPPPTLLNGLTWAAHMGFSSNLRYQTLNGTEFLLEKVLNPVLFKTSVVVLRCANNVLGGMTFVMLARLTGSQNAGEEKPSHVNVGLGEKDKVEIEKFLENNNQTTPSK
jgi:protein quaking